MGRNTRGGGTTRPLSESTTGGGDLESLGRPLPADKVLRSIGLAEGAGARDGEDHRDEAKSGKAMASRAEAAANQSRLPPREDHRTI